MEFPGFLRKIPSPISPWEFPGKMAFLPRNEMTPRAKRWVFLTIAVITFPLFLLTLLFALSVVNPMGLAFLTSFDVVNETEEPLFVTPIGAIGSRGERYILPHSISRSFYVMGIKQSEFQIPPCSTRKFTYDWDLIQFSEILVRRITGKYHFIGTGLDPVMGQYRRPEADRFVIADLDTIPVAGDDLLLALSKNTAGGWTIYILAGVGLFSPVFYILAQKNKTKAEGSGGQQSTRPK
ncbi:MAG: hypothetical protein KDM63_05685 [Verrucomicrobiae bacterium]|nr:hypothetical protein [Verrucomicrobiae bacterium]